jgi:cytochrome P450
MQALADRDYYTDYEILKDPYGYFAAAREKGPIYKPEGQDYYVVTGFEEAVTIMRNHDAFSAVINLQGAGSPLPFTPEGSDINDQIVAHRKEFVGWDMVSNMDDDRHTKLRALINTLFVPSRLKASEEFINHYCTEMVGKAVANGKVELIREIATPYVTMVVADLLGVPMEDRKIFMDAIAAAPPPGSLDGKKTGDPQHSPFTVMAKYFWEYIADRRANPRDDILTEFAFAKYIDGSIPEEYDLVQLGMFMFGAGQDTSAKLLGTALKFLIMKPELQDQLRADPTMIPLFIEEVLRLEGSTKQEGRLARKDATVGGVHIPAGSRIMIAIAGANRDPRRWENPNELKVGRPKIAEHVAFGRGKHTCAGAPLARAEVRIILEKLLSATSKIDIDLEQHPGGVADLVYEESFIIHGLSALHLRLTPSTGTSPS